MKIFADTDELRELDRNGYIALFFAVFVYCPLQLAALLAWGMWCIR